MRLVAEHPQQELIGKFLNYLHSRGIAAELRPCGSESWGLWVHHEDYCRDVRREFDAFLRNPAATKYAVAPSSPAGADQDAQIEARQRAESLAAVARRHGLHGGPVPVTKCLLALSILITLPLLLGRDRYGEFSDIGKRIIAWLYADSRMASQWWRLFTPVFLHFNWLHIIFNMLWLRELGGRIERIKGSGFMLLFFGVTSAISNYAQFAASGGLFGGMSGVVYGLFGYIWVKSRVFPEEGFMIDPSMVMMLMLWFFLGWSGLAGPIANWAHGFGLLSGILLALAPGRAGSRARSG